MNCVRSWNKLNPSDNWRIKPQRYPQVLHDNNNNNNNWRLIPQWYPYYGKSSKSGTVRYQQYASGWQQLIDNHRTYRNFRKCCKVKHWKNTLDEQKGIERMVGFLNCNPSSSLQQKITYKEKTTTKMNMCNGGGGGHHYQYTETSPELTPLSLLLLPPSLSSSSSLLLPDEGSVKVFSLSSYDNDLFAAVIRNIRTFSSQRNHILYLAVLVLIFLRESSLQLTTDLCSMFTSPAVESLLKRLVIILRYKKKMVDSCIIVYNVERIAYNMICNHYHYGIK